MVTSRMGTDRSPSQNASGPSRPWWRATASAAFTVGELRCARAPLAQSAQPAGAEDGRDDELLNPRADLETLEQLRPFEVEELVVEEPANDLLVFEVLADLAPLPAVPEER